MKAAAILAGARADYPAQLVTDDGTEIALAVRCLDAVEASGVREAARAFAVAKGVASPEDGEPIYDLALMVETLAVACLDAESPAGKREAFFASVAEVRRLRPEQIAHLYEQQRHAQEAADPKIRRMKPDEFVAAAFALGSEDEGAAARFFTRLGPGMQWTCARFLALRLVESLTPSSSSSSDSAPSTPG